MATFGRLSVEKGHVVDPLVMEEVDFVWRYSLIDVSVVSHGHGSMVHHLVLQLLRFPCVSKVILTLNIAEELPNIVSSRVEVVRNGSPKGFGANHNAAFSLSSAPYFCVLNPDILFHDDPFTSLVDRLCELGVDLIAPGVLCPKGKVEDSIRYFPGVVRLFKKLVGFDDGAYQIKIGHDQLPLYPEWVAGMFMLFRSESYERVGGFDEGFFLYYEDVDICVRLWQQGMRVAAYPVVSVVHDAQRASRGDLRHAYWHLSSIIRYFIKHWGRLPRLDK